MFRYFVFVCVAFLMLSCQEKSASSGLEYEFVKVDSLVLDILETVHVMDYHKEKGLYLLVKQASMEGHYFVVNDSGEILAENKLSEGPDAFGMVLLRAGFVGDEILFLSDRKAFLYDLNLKPLRNYPFKQNPRVRLVHFSLDNLSTFRFSDGGNWVVSNLNDGYLSQYPMDYFDTLNLVHLVNVNSGQVIRGGRLEESGKFRSGEFYPLMDKPVFFSDGKSNLISTILYGDSTFYQLDPQKGFQVVNKVALPRLKPDVLISVPMAEASLATVKEFTEDNVKFAGAFDEMMGNGNEVLVGYRTGEDLDIVALNQNRAKDDEILPTRKRFYYFIKEGKLMGNPIPWTFPGSLKLNVGKGRYLQYADQAEIHAFEKEYQCYYIYELRQKD
ncbi:hypothetical protein [Algoriphagus sp. CAU 1675]|uniref:hypothetical protein n=1 Tax=Algoriphagus sp. CAU 1675 TaxID=3032597 RepID=UPI0023D9B670|nr:hypothetical protein [Algoriphagus sp. CAU 1675]MDF2159068.1 hypothetical protein [Algoriphagus sp. CAU 1675]